jgi:hypothetical protein
VLKPKVFQAADIDTNLAAPYSPGLSSMFRTVTSTVSSPSTHDGSICLSATSKKLLRMSHLYYVGTFRMAIVGHNQR